MAGSALLPPSGAPRPLHVLVDTNVVLDLFLRREPWLTQAQPLWDARDAGRVYAHLSASVVTDIFYICRRQVGIDEARRAVEFCLRGFTIVTIDRSVLEAAFALQGNDFEDNVQIACAQSAGLDLIITRDAVDYQHSPVPAIAPPDIAKHLAP